MWLINTAHSSSWCLRLVLQWRYDGEGLYWHLGETETETDRRNVLQEVAVGVGN